MTLIMTTHWWAKSPRRPLLRRLKVKKLKNEAVRMFEKHLSPSCQILYVQCEDLSCGDYSLLREVKSQLFFLFFLFSLFIFTMTGFKKKAVVVKWLSVCVQRVYCKVVTTLQYTRCTQTDNHFTTTAY